MSVRVVIDCSALLAYVAGNIGVGETLAELAAAHVEGHPDMALVPAYSLMGALSAVTEPEQAARLQVLCALPQVTLGGSSDAGDAFEAGEFAARLGIEVELAAAVLLAARHDAALLTRHGDWLREVWPPADDWIIDVEGKA